MLGELQTRDSVNQYNFFSKYSIKKNDIEFNIVSNGDKIIYIQESVNSLSLNSWQHQRKLKEAFLVLYCTIFEFSRGCIYKDIVLVWRMITPTNACFLSLRESTAFSFCPTRMFCSSTSHCLKYLSVLSHFAAPWTQVWFCEYLWP